jgi:hypothetical protein
LTAPYPPPPVPQRTRRRGGVVGPLILIFIGAVFLLENTGYLPPNFWVNLWRLWPLILVLVGIELLLARRIPWLAVAGLAAVILVLGAVAINLNAPGQAGPAGISTSAQTDLGDARQADVTLRFGAGQLNVGPIDQPKPHQLASMSYAGPPSLAPQPQYSVSGGVGRLEYSSSGRGGPGGFVPFGDGGGSSSARVDLTLTPGVPITSLNVQTGAADAHLDLSRLNISQLDMSVGAATTWLRFPEAAGLTAAHIRGGASTITLEVPQGVAAQIEHHGGISTLNVDQSRFPQVSDSVFRSPDYESAKNKVELNIETGFTTIQLN